MKLLDGIFMKFLLSLVAAKISAGFVVVVVVLCYTQKFT